MSDFTQSHLQWVFSAIIFAVTLLNPLLGILMFLIAIQLYQAREHYGTLEKCGFPVIKPTWFRGSEPNLHSVVTCHEDVKNAKKYGGIWGSYLGKTPFVVISDPELIRLIFVKDSEYFSDRSIHSTGTRLIDDILGFQRGERWKYLRTSMTPLFTTSKIKLSSIETENSLKELLDSWMAECGPDGRLKIDCGQRLSAWLIDLMTRITFGIKIDDYENPDNKFAHAFRTMMGDYQEYNVLLPLSMSFPLLGKLAPTCLDEPAKFISSVFRRIFENRHETIRQNPNTYLPNFANLWESVGTQKFKDLGIDEQMVLGHAMSVYIGGYNTATAEIAHLLLYMAENPDVQEKMHFELMSGLERQQTQDINYDFINDLEIPYISACVMETLRMGPAVSRFDRLCTKDWTHGNISIKKGMVVDLSSWAANRNPDVYPDPEKFKPERFLPENAKNLNPYAFTTFGFGKRQCAGTRVIHMMMKLFACHFVKQFRVEKRSDTQMKYKASPSVFLGFYPLYVDIVPR